MRALREKLNLSGTPGVQVWWEFVRTVWFQSWGTWGQAKLKMAFESALQKVGLQNRTEKSQRIKQD
jgi:hypothetical protein